MKIHGHGYAWLIDEAGIAHFRTHKRPPPIDLGENAFVVTGESELAKALVGQTGNYIAYMGVGTSSIAVTENDTALNAEVLPTGTPANRRQVQKNVIGSVFSGEAEYEPAAFGSTQTLTEFGYFSAITGGIMYNHLVYATGLSKTTSNLLVVKMDIGFN